MPSEVTRYRCTEGCSRTFDTPGACEMHERRHQMTDLIERISEVHDHKHFVQEEVVDFLEDWLEYGYYATGLTECQRCGSMVHERLEECPECRGPVHELQTSATLRCIECDGRKLTVGRKRESRQRFGLRCMECGNFVAHLNGVFNLLDHVEMEDMGYWEEDEES